MAAVTDFHQLDDFGLKSLQGSKESTVTVHVNGPESVVISKERSEGFRMELVITEVQRGVDRLERLKVSVHFLPFTLLSAALNDLLKISVILYIIFIPSSHSPDRWAALCCRA